MPCAFQAILQRDRYILQLNIFNKIQVTNPYFLFAIDSIRLFVTCFIFVCSTIMNMKGL